MTDKKVPEKISRREFFKQSGMAAGAAGGMALAATTGAESATVAAGGTKKAGYRETDHVRRYYELAKF